MILIRRIIKFCLAVIVYYSGLLTLLSYIKRKYKSQINPVILMYHCVLKDNDWQKQYLQPSLFVSQRTFDKQMAFLSKYYNVISLKELVKILQNKQPLPSKCAVITFDDGWRDNYLNAYPILKKYNISATIFLTTDFISTNNIFWFLQVSILLAGCKMNPQKMTDILKKVKSENENSPSVNDLSDYDIEAIKGDSDRFFEALKKLDYDIIQKVIALISKECDLSLDKIIQNKWILSWDEVIKMSHENIDFGSHGQSHRILTKLNSSEIQKELINSKNIIEENIGKECKLFSYPNGDYNSEIKKLVQEARYSSAITTSGQEIIKKEPDLFALKRLGIHEGAALSPTGRFSKTIFTCLIERIF